MGVRGVTQLVRAKGVGKRIVFSEEAARHRAAGLRPFVIIDMSSMEWRLHEVILEAIRTATGNAVPFPEIYGEVSAALAADGVEKVFKSL